MTAKSIVWMFAGRLHRVLVLYLLLAGLLVHEEDGLTVNAQDPDAGKLYLDLKELNVKEIAGNATLNNANCGNLNGCSAECSRVTCHPVSGGRDSLQCTSVDNNEFYKYICPTGACRDKMMVDYHRSYVTLPAPASTNLQTEVARDICLQRKLESTFKTMSFPSNYSLVYFGSTSGAFRSFPGREQNETQCTSYDPRKRPWYLNGVSVSKDVKILVDVASSMGRLATVEYKRPPKTTYLDVTKNLTLELLQTFSPQDFVEVFSFDSSSATSLGGAVQVTSSYDFLDPGGRPELDALVRGVNQLAASPHPDLSGLNAAILKAVSSFNPTNSLKVIIVLSNGLFVPLNSTTFPSVDLQRTRAKLMVYKLPTNDDSGDPFLLKTPSLQENICSVKGSFETLDAPATANPLYSMRSYFTYLARTQLTAVGNNATWSNPYTSITQARNVITPTYPAFGSDGLLIGVAGIAVVIDNLHEPLRTLVYEDFKRRNRGALTAPANISMTCSYQNKPANTVCPDSTPPDSSAICLRTDTSSSLADRTCCGTCGLGNVSKESGLKPWIAALISIATVALVAIIVALICWWKYHKGPPDGDSDGTIFIFPGDQPED